MDTPFNTVREIRDVMATSEPLSLKDIDLTEKYVTEQIQILETVSLDSDDEMVTSRYAAMVAIRKLLTSYRQLEADLISRMV